MKYLPFELSHRDESNDSKIIKIRPLGAKLPHEYSLWNNSVNIDVTDMKHLSFESLRCNDSNGSMIIKIQSLDAEIFAILYFILYVTQLFFNYVITFRITVSEFRISDLGNQFRLQL
jgi:hypothetical protein